MGNVTKLETGVIQIHGKDYQTVPKRVNDFRLEYNHDFSIETDIIQNDETYIVIKASIKDKEGRIISNGYAEEKRGSTNINKTSALENAETSAVGRALAFAGYGTTQIATAEEIATAVEQQKELNIEEIKKPVVEFFKSYISCVGSHLSTIDLIKACIANYKTYLEVDIDKANESLSEAAEAWYELDQDTQKTLFLAPTKGGIFTTQERDVIASSEFRKAHYGE